MVFAGGLRQPLGVEVKFGSQSLYSDPLKRLPGVVATGERSLAWLGC